MKPARIFFAFILFIGFALPASLHADVTGCQLVHSCPSPTHSYVCGDLGDCSKCPDNNFCRGGQPRAEESASLTAPDPLKQCLKFKQKKKIITPERLMMFCLTELDKKECQSCLKMEKEDEPEPKN